MKCNSSGATRPCPDAQTLKTVQVFTSGFPGLKTSEDSSLHGIQSPLPSHPAWTGMSSPSPQNGRRHRREDIGCVSSPSSRPRGRKYDDAIAIEAQFRVLVLLAFVLEPLLAHGPGDPGLPFSLGLPVVRLRRRGSRGRENADSEKNRSKSGAGKEEGPAGDVLLWFSFSGRVSFCGCRWSVFSP